MPCTASIIRVKEKVQLATKRVAVRPVFSNVLVAYYAFSWATTFGKYPKIYRLPPEYTVSRLRRSYSRYIRCQICHALLAIELQTVNPIGNIHVVS